MAGDIGLPDGLSRDDAYVQGMADGEALLQQRIDAALMTLGRLSLIEASDRTIYIIGDAEDILAGKHDSRLREFLARQHPNVY